MHNQKVFIILAVVSLFLVILGVLIFIIYKRLKSKKSHQLLNSEYLS